MPNIPDYYAAHSPKSVVPNTAISRVAARLLPIMAAFSSLRDRLSNAFKHLKSKGKLSEADIDGTVSGIYYSKIKEKSGGFFRRLRD